MKSFIGAVLFICVAFSANAQLLWKVSGNGLNQPSYIIGTIWHRSASWIALPDLKRL